MPNSAEQVAEGIYRVADGVVNLYLVVDDGAVALVDTGWPRSWPVIELALEELGRSPGDVAAILLTHGHADHLGAAERARGETAAPVMAVRGEVERVRGKAKGSSPWNLVPALSLQLWRPNAAKFVGEATVKGFLTPTWVEEVAPFDVGETLDVPGRPEVVATPGHTPNHVSFRFGEQGALISGDAIVTRDPVTGARGPRLAHDGVNEDPATTRRSLGTIAGVDAELLLPGHGEPWRGSMSEAAAEAQAHA